MRSGNYVTKPRCRRTSTRNSPDNPGDKTSDAYANGSADRGKNEGRATSAVVCTHFVLVVAHAVHPEAHGHAYEHGARRDQTDADVPDGGHGLRVVVGQPEPVEQRADAHQRHAEPVRPLRFFRHY